MKNQKVKEKTKSGKEKPNTAIVVALIGLSGTIIAALLGSPLIEKRLAPVNGSTATPTISATVAPTTGITEATILLATEPPPLTSIPAQTVNDIEPQMMLISAGSFMMGSDAGSLDEQPVHEVYLDDFYMDTYEVTNALYKACVDDGSCISPIEIRSETHPVYYGNPEFLNYPVIFVDWNMATSYCLWLGKRLPTEAEWEKAARGMDNRPYPWGKEFDLIYANYAKKTGDTQEVGLYEIGKSPYGIYDMAGNVWEWVADLYQENYYEGSPLSNPLGPQVGDYHVMRGGSWFNYNEHMRVSNREGYPATYADINIGFRCARDATP